MSRDQNTQSRLEPRNRSIEPVANFTLANTLPTDKVTSHFSIHELVKSDLAARRRIHNWFSTTADLQAAVYLTRIVLEPLRALFGPIMPNSVYRSQQLERALKGKLPGWKSTSQHTKGQAADIEIGGLTNVELAHYIMRNMQFDQLILECVDTSIPDSGWVHVSVVEGKSNRGEVLSYIANDGGFVYVKGLITMAGTHEPHEPGVSGTDI